MSVYMSECHFLKEKKKRLYSTSNTFYWYTLKYKIVLNKNNFFFFLNQNLSLFLNKSWFYTFSFYVCQNIHFTGIFIIYKIFYRKKYEFYVFNKFKSRLCSYININFLQFLFYFCQNIHFTNIFIRYKIFWIKKFIYFFSFDIFFLHF